MNTNNYLLYFDKKMERLILVYDENYNTEADVTLARFWDGTRDGIIASCYLEDHCELVAWDLNGMVGENIERRLKLVGG